MKKSKNITTHYEIEWGSSFTKTVLRDTSYFFTLVEAMRYVRIPHYRFKYKIIKVTEEVVS